MATPSHTVGSLACVLDQIAPPHLAEDWDNVGLLVGRADRELVGPVLFTVDLTEAVMDEAIGRGCSAVVAYHPPIFQSLKRVVSTGSVSQRVVLAAIEAKIAICSPHTALDAASGGLTDWLADGVQGPDASADRRAIKHAARLESSQEVKIVTFVPENHLERVRGALASSGAGIIGAYESCSFSIVGEGTFMGAPGTTPAVGQAGMFETVHERRLEMVCSRKALSLAMATLRQFHPYEAPAIDVYPLEPAPLRHVGVGRRVKLDRGMTLAELAGRLKKHLGVHGVHVAPAVGVNMQTTRLDRLGVLPGAGGSIAPMALADGCQVYVTGEMKHHETLAMLAAGMSVITAGHTQTERGYLPVLAQRVGKQLPGVECVASTADREVGVVV